LYCKRTFVHWYVGIGFNEDIFREARESLKNLIKNNDELSVDSVLDENDESDEND